MGLLLISSVLYRPMVDSISALSRVVNYARSVAAQRVVRVTHPLHPCSGGGSSCPWRRAGADQGESLSVIRSGSRDATGSPNPCAWSARGRASLCAGIRSGSCGPQPFLSAASEACTRFGDRRSGLPTPRQQNTRQCTGRELAVGVLLVAPAQSGARRHAQCSVAQLRSRGCPPAVV